MTDTTPHTTAPHTTADGRRAAAPPRRGPARETGLLASRARISGS